MDSATERMAWVKSPGGCEAGYRLDRGQSYNGII